MKNLYDFGELPPTLNRLLASHWRTRANAKARWTLLLREAIGLNRLPDPCEVFVTWRVMRLQDDDNSRGRFKVIGDALKRAGYIIDDSPEHLHLNVDQVRVAHRNEQGFLMVIREYLPFSDKPRRARKSIDRERIAANYEMM